MTIGKEIGNNASVAYERYQNSLENSSNNNNKSNSAMLASQRLPIHLEYLQTHITTTESKASPLALLAQTCSSIGKTENEDSDIKTTSTTLNKLSAPDEDNKSSFKPYKLSDVTPTVRSSTSSLMTTSDRNSSPPSSSVSSRVPPISSSSSIESEKSRCYPESSSEYPLKCHTTSPPIPHLGGKGGTPYIHHSHSHSHHSHRDHSECVQCKTMRPQSDPLPIMNRTPVPGTPGLCQCQMCLQARDSYKCHYQGSSSMPPLYPPSYKHPNLAPMITCRDPNCGNCSKFSHSSIQNFLHPALVHQCTHNGSHKSSSYPVPPPPANLTPYDSYLKGTPNPKPYVCNWVSEGKHCGNTFITSEELFQHLRTHTNAQQQQNHCEKPHSVIPPQSPSVPATCNIHGCPCGANRKSSPPGKGISAYGIGPSPRYSPYSRMLPSGVSSHSYAPHSMFHY